MGARMEPKDFAAWVDLMQERGLSYVLIAKSLGCGINQIARWQTRRAPLYIGLAVAALMFNLPPWRPGGKS